MADTQPLFEAINGGATSTRDVTPPGTVDATRADGPVTSSPAAYGTGGNETDGLLGKSVSMGGKARRSSGFYAWDLPEAHPWYRADPGAGVFERVFRWTRGMWVGGVPLTPKPQHANSATFLCCCCMVSMLSGGIGVFLFALFLLMIRDPGAKIVAVVLLLSGPGLVLFFSVCFFGLPTLLTLFAVAKESLLVFVVLAAIGLAMLTLAAIIAVAGQRVCRRVYGPFGLNWVALDRLAASDTNVVRNFWINNSTNPDTLGEMLSHLPEGDIRSPWLVREMMLRGVATCQAAPGWTPVYPRWNHHIHFSMPCREFAEWMAHEASPSGLAPYQSWTLLNYDIQDMLALR